MKLAEVQIGGVYLTRVSGELVRVRVLREGARSWRMGEVTKCPECNGSGVSYASGRGPRLCPANVVERIPYGPTRFVVARLDTGRELPNSRTAGALRPAPEGS